MVQFNNTLTMNTVLAHFGLAGMGRIIPKGDAGERRITEQPGDTSTRLISHQASHRVTDVAIGAAARCHVGRIHDQVVHFVAIAEGRGPPVAVSTLIDRNISDVVARQRRR